MIRHHVKHATIKLTAYLQIGLLALPIALGTVPLVSAAELTARSVRVSTSQPGTVAQHLFTFNVPSSANIGSIAFEYCTNSPLDSVICVPPAGLDLSAAIIAAQTTNTGFSISVPDSSAGRIVLTRAASPGVVGASSYRFNNILNPTTAGQTTFVRIFTYGTTNGTSPVNDKGSVAFSVANLFEVSAYVPPYLTFCVGVFVTLNCNSVTGSGVDIGELQTNGTATGTMQFSGATNDESGYTTYLNGFTMTSGNNVITALSSNNASQPGTSQFGLNLRANSNPSVGLDPVGVGSSTPTAGYGSPNSFRFVNGEAITTTNLPTDFKVFTAAYIVNVPPNQPPGVYVTTMTYTAVASF